MTPMPAVDPILDGMSADLRELIRPEAPDRLAMIGIHTGGLWIAERLHRAMGLRTALGSLDIGFYRDDFDRVGMKAQVRPTQVPFDVDDLCIILVDDVLHSGRTIRAALNEIFDYGRPAAVRLAVLVDRGGRELPIAADVVGARVTADADQRIKLRGPDPLELTLKKHTP